MQKVVVILLAGNSSRFGHPDKCTKVVGGIPVVLYSWIAFLQAGLFSQFIFTYRDLGQRFLLEPYIKEILALFDGNFSVFWVQGGDDRKNSVMNSLEFMAAQQPSPPKYVFIHDGARPLITPKSVIKLDDALKKSEAAVLAHKITDTTASFLNPSAELKPFHSLNNLEYIDRSALWALETPQAFEFKKLHGGYQSAIAKKLPITDDSGAFPGHITIVENEDYNPKITYSKDWPLLEYLIQQKAIEISKIK